MKRCLPSILLLAVVLHFQICSSHKVLIVSAIAPKSYLIPLSAYSNALTARGHEVTFMLPNKMSLVPKDAKQIILKNIPDIVTILNSSVTGFQVMKNFKDALVNRFCEAVSTGKELRHHLKSVQYDILVVNTAAQQCLLSTILKYQKNSPFIMYHQSVIIVDTIASVTGVNFWDVAFNPMYTQNLSDQMNFGERIGNLIAKLSIQLFAYYFVYGREEILIKNLGPDHIDTGLVERNASFIFVNSNFEFDYPLPMSPEVIMTGCMQCRPSKKLPEHLQKIFARSEEHGVIVFSLGTVLSSETITSNKLETFLEAFSQIPQTVLWHSELDIKNASLNIHFEKWLPLQDILGHNLTKVIISHGGLNTLQETFYHGVPYLGLPLLGDKSDRRRNVKLAERRGIGLQLQLNDLSSAIIVHQLDQLINNTKFKENAKKISYHMKDQMTTATERAVFYTEFAIRVGRKDTVYKSHARNLSFIQLYSLDVILILSFYAILFFVALKLLYRWTKFLVTNAKKLIKKKTD